MKRLIVLMLILMMSVALFSSASLVMAESPNLSSGDVIVPNLDTEKLNNPIDDDNNYYIDIQNPDIFAKSGKLLLVAQGDDVIAKIGRKSSVETLKGAAIYEEGGKKYPLRSITIEPSLNNVYYVHMTYPLSDFKYKTIIYKCTLMVPDVPNFPYFEMDGDNYKTYTFGTYLLDKGITLGGTDTENASIIDALDNSAREMCYAQSALYVLVNNNNGQIYKITNASLTSVPLAKDEGTKLHLATEFTVSDNGDMYIYAMQDGRRVLLGLNNDTFEEIVASPEIAKYISNDLLDIAARGNHLYLLTSKKIVVTTMTLDSIVYQFAMKNDPTMKSFCIDKVVDNYYINFTTDNSHNIQTYKILNNEGILSFEFASHFGAHCICDKPCQGFLNAPTKIVALPTENLAYVLDNNGTRIVVMVKKAYMKYVQYFIDTASIGIDTATNIGLDRFNDLYIASGNEIRSYRNVEDYENAPLRANNTYSGFDSNIKDMFISNTMTSVLYAITENNTLYTISEGSTKPIKVFTFSEDVKSISPSYDNTKIYVATAHSIKSYSMDNIDPLAPLTNLDVASTIRNIEVDYKGNIFASTDENVIRVFARIDDNVYDNVRTLSRGQGRWKNISDFFFVPRSGSLYIVDTALHIAEKNKEGTEGYTLYAIDTDYEDKNTNLEDTFVAKTNKDTRMYFAPNNYERYKYVGKNEYFYVLAKDKTNANMYKVVDSNDNIRYMKISDLDRVNATQDSSIGNEFIPLSSTTKIYQYPYSTSPVIMEISGVMTFINNVAYDNDKIVWQNENTKWYKVEYDVETPIRGYVKLSDIAINKDYGAPSTNVYLRVTTKVGEYATMYAQPNPNMGVVLKKLPDHALVRLLDKDFNKSRKYTRVEYKNDKGDVYIGYVLTANLQENKITPMQIVAIVATVLTVLITIAVIILVLQIRKKRNNMNTFKNKDEE